MRVLGLKVRSGFAIGVIVDGPLASWKIERRLEVSLTEGEAHYARFPFHPLVDIDGESGEAESRRYVGVVESAARKSLSLLLPTIAPLRHAVIVAGSLIDPDKVANPHMRVHAREGQLFRRVVCEALALQGVPYDCVSEKQVAVLGAGVLGLSCERFKSVIAAAGRGRVKPWSRDEKLAACGALWKLAP